MGALVAIYILTPVASAEPKAPYAPVVAALLLMAGACLLCWNERSKLRARRNDPDQSTYLP
jgi:hypothetical protein